MEGEISPDPKDPQRVLVWLLNGKNPLSFERKKILETIPKTTPLDEYLVKRAQASSEPVAQFELGEWCEKNKLSDLAFAHYEAALSRDKEFEPAHRKLGHVFHDGHWLSRDELRSLQGLIKYKGRWITPEEKSQFESNAKLVGTQNSMLRRFRILRQSLIEGTDDHRREAEMQLMQIREPEAITPLTRVFGNDAPEGRKLLIQILGNIPGPEGAAALVSRLLLEVDPDVRHSALEQLKQREARLIEPRLTRALQSSNIAIVNRAAWAIGHLGLVSAVPKLIPALISTEEETVWTNQDGTVLNPTLASVGGGGIARGPSYYGPTGSLLAFNGNYAAYLTPPAVAPGAIAFGAYTAPFYGYAGNGYPLGTSTPYVGGPMDGGGSSSSSPNRGPIMRIVVVPYENLEVHDALISLTGKEFGYDIPAWKNWLKNEFNLNPTPTRRVPQP